MVFVSTKKIKGKKRYYLEKSIRLPSGKLKKYSVYLKEYRKNSSFDSEKYETLLEEKIKKEIRTFAGKHYEKNSIYTEDLLGKLELMKRGYKKILVKLTKKQMQDVIDRFTVNFTYESNAIEGNSLTLKDVTMILHEKKVANGKDLREVYETLNTRQVMNLVFANKLKIRERDILKLHEMLVKDTGVTLGYKKLPNFLLRRSLKTTPPENVGKKMKDLVEWYNQNEMLHPLQKAVIFHGKFEKIHPFEDGNGRVGRLLINIALISRGYPPLIVRKSQRVAYFSALEAFDDGYEGKLQRFFIQKHKDTYNKFFEVYMKYLK